MLIVISIFFIFFSLCNGLTIRQQTTEPRKLFVGIGDSWTAGEGGGSHSSYARSPNAYPLVAAKILNWEGSNLARSGAKINDISEQLKQFSTLSSLPTHIVVGIGGNDLGVADAIIQVTLMNNLTGIANKLVSIKPRLVAVYETIQNHVPLAKVYAVPYPNFVGSDNTFPNTANACKMMNLLTTTIEEAAAEANIGYIDVSDAFHTHEMFSNDPYIWGLFDRYVAHPKQNGYAKMGEIVAAYIKAESE